MSVINTQAIADSRKVLTGSDGCMYDGKGKLLATVETFQSKANFSNLEYRALGSPMKMEIGDAVSTTLSITMTVIESDDFIDGIEQFQTTGKMPEWNFQGAVRGKNGSTERKIYNYCVPSGDIDLQNVTVGSIIKRTLNFHVNGGVKTQGKMKQ